MGTNEGFFLLISLSLFPHLLSAISSSTRCREDFTNNLENLVTIKNGIIQGVKTTELDGRQNKNVTWTSYFVSWI